MQVSEEAIKIAQEEIEKQLINMEIPTVEDIKKSAKEVLLIAQTLQSDYFITNQIQQQLSNSTESNALSNIASFSRKMVQTKENFTDLMRSVFTLQEKVNNFLHQKVQMVYTYIDKNGEVTLYQVENTVEGLKVDRASMSHGGTISGRYKHSKKELKKMTQIVNEKSEQGVKGVFKEVHRRAVLSKKIHPAKGNLYILWKENEAWEGVQVTGMGVLAETYASFYLNSYIFNTPYDSEGNVKTFMVHPDYGAVQVDAASGFLQGDVSVGGMQYGIKAAGATAMGYRDIIKYAQEIIDTQDLEGYLTGLKKYLQDEGRKKILSKRLEGSIEETFEDLIQGLEKK